MPALFRLLYGTGLRIGEAGIPHRGNGLGPRLHDLRHTFACHSSISTTEVYARADSKLKREALEKAYINVAEKQVQGSPWLQDAELLDWLYAR